jgi:hypothetical protein
VGKATRGPAASAPGVASKSKPIAENNSKPNKTHLNLFAISKSSS